MQTSLSIKEPGLNTLPPGVERYVINGGGLTGIQILPDDEIEIINDEEVFVNENIFSRSITNVLNNAIVQSDKIIIKADINKNLIKINIHDNGIGIPDSEKDNVFKPFYRIDQSRNQNVSNSGLGLATTKSLLNSINGKISLHDSYLGGLEVAIEIPN